MGPAKTEFSLTMRLVLAETSPFAHDVAKNLNFTRGDSEELSGYMDDQAGLLH